MRAMREHDEQIVDGGLSEVSPGDTGWDATVGARLLYKMIGLAPATQQGRAGDPGAHGSLRSQAADVCMESLRTPPDAVAPATLQIPYPPPQVTYPPRRTHHHHRKR